MLSCIVCKEEKSEQDISLESDDTVCIDCDEEVKTDKHLEQFVVEETDSDEEAQELRDGSDYQKFMEEG